MTPRPQVDASFPPILAELFRPHRHKAIYGGRGSAKSWSVARYLLIQAADHHERVLCARELQNSLSESVLQLMEDQIEALNLGRYFKVYKDSIGGPHDSSFIFKGLRNNSSEIKSMERLTKSWIEEAAAVSEASMEDLIPTLRDDDSEIIYTWNPKLETDYVQKTFVLNTPPPGSWVQAMNWRDNPWFPKVLEAEKEHCRLTNPVKYDWIWEGQCLRASLDSLWTFEGIEAKRVTLSQADLAPIVRKVVAVDPAVTSGKRSDETGIVVAGATNTRPRHYYVYADLTGRLTPDGWARLALDAYDQHDADAIVYETNQGGDLVPENIRNACRAAGREIPKLIGVRATKGKALRAEPVAALYEQGLVHHVGHLPDLERQMLRFDPFDPGQKSPDRLDALVWAITELSSSRVPMKIAANVLTALTTRRR